MDALHIIIADKSQLLRLGIAGLLHQTGYPVQIQEISDYNKFQAALLKENLLLVFVSAKFLSKCNKDTFRNIRDRRKQLKIVLINTENELPDTGINFVETIDDDDTEKIIAKKTIKVLENVIKESRNFAGGDEISTREKEVLRLVAKGMTNKEIAENLFISTHTVIAHRKNITAKLGIKTIAGLTVYAVINKLIPIEDIK